MRYAQYEDIDSWVRIASSRASFMAAAIDHLPTAIFLVAHELVGTTGPLVSSRKLRAVSTYNNRTNHLAIAALILEAAPPPWLSSAARGGRVLRELIPSGDLDALGWMGDDLDRVLRDAALIHASRSTQVQRGLGLAAELVVLACLESTNAQATHVALIGDHFGYDIETPDKSGGRIEVKGCTIATEGQFFLSRNEYAKCLEFENQWRLVQVVFRPEVLTVSRITQDTVMRVNVLTWSHVIEPAPDESPDFRWEIAARIRVASTKWTAFEHEVPSDLDIASVTELANARSDG